MKKKANLSALFWPVNRSEAKQVFLKASILFLLCCCYSILRNLKDTVILSETGSVEVIPFIKVWGMVPGALLATWVYTRLCNRFNRTVVFYILISSFLFFFLCFAFLIYPHHHSLHFHTLSNYLSSILPSGCKGLIAMVRNWSFTLFYIISELWASTIIAVLFWGFINDMTRMSQGKRFYGIFNLGSNMAPLIGVYLANVFVQNFPFDLSLFTTDRLGEVLTKSVLFIVICGLLAMYFFSKLAKRAAADSGKRGKIRLSIRDSIKFISNNKYLLCLTIIVLGFNVAVNFADILWKHQLKSFFQEPSDMLAHMNKVSMGIGALSTVGALSFSFLISRRGWTFTAILTPLIMAGLATIFFIFLFSGWTLLSITPLALTLYLGSIQNCLSKAGKYSIFDASKEIAFLKMDRKIRLKGKAAIDGLASSIGKSGSSLTYQILLVLCGSLSACTPYIAFLLVFVFGGWFYSIKTIGNTFKRPPLKEEQGATFEASEASRFC